MAEFYGSEFQVLVQKRMQARQSWFEQTPGAANGGRLLNFPDPESVGWDVIAGLFKEDGVMAFTAQRPDALLSKLQDRFGDTCQYPVWDVFMGENEEVTDACRSRLEECGIPRGWRLDCFTAPGDALIEEVQELNLATGVAPYPAFYMRSEALPCLTACLWDETSRLVATASASYRYHPEGRFAGHVFNGSVSVDPECRGLGLSKLVNATALIESQSAFGWTGCLAQVQAKNAASRRMIEACGMRRSDRLKTVAVIASDESFTR